MKVHPLIKLSVSTVFILFSTKVSGQDQKLDITQKGDIISPENGVINLKKSPFELAIPIRPRDVVVLNVSTDSTNINLVSQGTSRDCLHFFRPGTGMADHPKNKSRVLFVKNSDNSYWGYFPERNDSGFDRELVSGGTMTGVRTIENIQIFNQGANKRKFAVADIPVEELFIVYYVISETMSGKRQSGALQILKIAFEE